MLTLRLDDELEMKVEQMAHKMNISKSELVRLSLIQYLDGHEEPSAYDLGVAYFGKYSSGDGSLSIKKGNQLADQIRDHHERKKTR